MKLRDLPPSEQPRERFVQLGAGGASQRELLAILLRTGTREHDALALADSLFERFGDLTGLACASLFDLRAVAGIGLIKAIEIKAALELGKRAALAQPELRTQIKTPADAAALLMPLCGASEQEEVWVLCLDTRNRVLQGSPQMLYRGSLNSASLRVSELFKQAIRCNAAGVIVAHNHPSFDVSASSNDIHVTRELIKAGKLLEIDVLDHLILSPNSFCSLKERRLGFE